MLKLSPLQLPSGQVYKAKKWAGYGQLPDSKWRSVIEREMFQGKGRAVEGFTLQKYSPERSLESMYV